MNKKDMVLTVFKHYVGNDSLNVVKYVSMAMDEVPFPSDDENESLSKYVDKIFREAVSLFAKEKSDVIIEDFGIYDEQLRQSIESKIDTSMSVFGVQNEFSNAIGKHFKNSLYGFILPNKKLEQLIKLNTFDNVNKYIVELYDCDCLIATLSYKASLNSLNDFMKYLETNEEKDKSFCELLDENVDEITTWSDSMTNDQIIYLIGNMIAHQKVSLFVPNGGCGSFGFYLPKDVSSTCWSVLIKKEEV